MSIADLGDVKEKDLLKQAQVSRKKLIISLSIRLFYYALIILFIDVVILFVLWTYNTIFVDITWALILESGIVLTYAGLGGTFRSSLSLNELIAIVTKTKRPIDRDMINKAVGNTISLSILGIYLFIFSVIFGILDIKFLFV